MIPAMNRHFWYFTEELLPCVLCSTQLAHEKKEVLARKLYLFNLYLEDQRMMFEPQKPIFPHISQSTQMSDLVGKHSGSCFNISSSAMMMFNFCAVLTISGSSMTRLRERLVMNMKVTNNTAERGIKILEDYKDDLTTDNEQRNVILHCVKNIRKKYPDFKKKL